MESWTYDTIRHLETRNYDRERARQWEVRLTHKPALKVFSEPVRAGFYSSFCVCFLCLPDLASAIFGHPDGSTPRNAGTRAANCFRIAAISLPQSSHQMSPDQRWPACWTWGILNNYRVADWRAGPASDIRLVYTYTMTWTLYIYTCVCVCVCFCVFLCVCYTCVYIYNYILGVSLSIMLCFLCKCSAKWASCIILTCNIAQGWQGMLIVHAC